MKWNDIIGPRKWQHIKGIHSFSYHPTYLPLPSHPGSDPPLLLTLYIPYLDCLTRCISCSLSVCLFFLYTHLFSSLLEFANRVIVDILLTLCEPRIFPCDIGITLAPLEAPLEEFSAKADRTCVEQTVCWINVGPPNPQLNWRHFLEQKHNFR